VWSDWLEPGHLGDAASMLDAVVYDLGGVFFPSPFAAVRRLAADRGISGDVLMAILFGPYDEDTDHPWHRAERGELDIAAVRTAIIELGRSEGHDVDLFAMLAELGGDRSVSAAMLGSVRRVRAAGAWTAILTNNIAEARDLWRELLPVDELFDLVVDSSEVGMRKPDPLVFRHTLEGLGVTDPGRVAFLDDYPGNVRAAESVGMIGILVEEDPAAAIARLDALLTS
jgi:epoxide hydrolase-like predicted phosphatase